MGCLWFTSSKRCITSRDWSIYLRKIKTGLKSKKFRASKTFFSYTIMSVPDINPFTAPCCSVNLSRRLQCPYSSEDYSFKHYSWESDLVYCPLSSVISVPPGNPGFLPRVIGACINNDMLIVSEKHKFIICLAFSSCAAIPRRNAEGSRTGLNIVSYYIHYSLTLPSCCHWIRHEWIV